MDHIRRVRVAIFTSAGLLPLACATGRAVDSDAATPPRDAAPPGVTISGDSAGDGSDGGSADPPPLAGCGRDRAVPAEQMGLGRGVTGNTPVLTKGIETGIHWCEGNGLLHRPEPVTCASGLPRPLPPSAAVNDAGAAPSGEDGALSQVEFLYPTITGLTAGCSADADCTERPLGYCAPEFHGGPRAYDIQCKYGCLSDDDCSAGELCECGDPVGHCVAAGCRSDGDCGGDLKCAAWFTPKVCSSSQFYTCQTSEDECNTEADCAEGFCSGADGQRRCVNPGLAACGRPFLVQDEARLAGLVQGTDWSDCDRKGTDAETRAAGPLSESVGAYWARAALMEHASIAAFARFTLQLLQLGAPRELIEASQQAMLDETSHAKVCFSLASRYLGRPVGPGPLSMDGALHTMGLEDIVLTAFREGCVGETVAALEACEARDAATDERVRRGLTRIGADELQHAELAWRFVRWALQLGEPKVESLVVAELARLEAEIAEAMSPIEPEVSASEHGVLSAGRRAGIRRLAIRDIVLPCGRELVTRVRQSGARLGSSARRASEADAATGERRALGDAEVVVGNRNAAHALELVVG